REAAPSAAQLLPVSELRETLLVLGDVVIDRCHDSLPVVAYNVGASQSAHSAGYRGGCCQASLFSPRRPQPARLRSRRRPGSRKLPRMVVARPSGRARGGQRCRARLFARPGGSRSPLGAGTRSSAVRTAPAAVRSLRATPRWVRSSPAAAGTR